MTNSQTNMINVSLNIDNLIKQSEKLQSVQNASSDAVANVNTTIFTLGSSNQISAKAKPSIPQILTLDTLFNNSYDPYLQLTFSINNTDINSANITYLYIFRRKLPFTQAFAYQPVTQYNSIAFNKLSSKLAKTGRFENTIKGLQNVSQNLTPQSISNSNLNNLQTTTNASPTPSLSAPSYIQGADQTLQKNYNQFIQVGTINIAQTLQAQTLQTVDIINSQTTTFTFNDTNIAFGETYEYYVQSISNDSTPSIKSSTIKVTVEDLTSIGPPLSVTTVQIDEQTINFSIILNSSDDVSSVIIWRKAENDISYSFITQINNVTDTVQFQDTGLKYLTTYSYRFFALNIHGTLSQPYQLTTFCSYHSITSKSHSNNFKIPMLNAAQDQNSNYIQIQIPVNDNKVSYYKLSRRDQTIFETKYQVPELTTTGYGSVNYPWPAGGMFFVTPSSSFVSTVQTTLNGTTTINLQNGISNTPNSSSIQTFSLNDVQASSSNNTIFNVVKTPTTQIINFIDITAQLEHTYSYRIQGFDLFGNSSPFQYSTTTCVGKNAIRSPINLQAQVVRDNPLRLLLTWDDDNITNLNSSNDTFIVQRRTQGQTQYQSWPATQNNWLIDEVATQDAIQFSTLFLSNSFEGIIEQNLTSSVLNIANQSAITRPFNFPPFLQNNNIYYYRIIALDQNNNQSNPTPEFQIRAVANISDPINFQVTTQDVRILPTTVVCTWGINQGDLVPDYWIIQRKIDIPNDVFITIGNAYIQTEFFDRFVQSGHNYIYQITAVDTFGRMSNSVQASIKL